MKSQGLAVLGSPEMIHNTTAGPPPQNTSEKHSRFPQGRQGPRFYMVLYGFMLVLCVLTLCLFIGVYLIFLDSF